MPTVPCPVCENPYDTSQHLKCPACGSVSLRQQPKDEATQDATVESPQASIHIRIEDASIVAGFKFGVGLFLAWMIGTALVWLAMLGLQFLARM